MVTRVDAWDWNYQETSCGDQSKEVGLSPRGGCSAFAAHGMFPVELEYSKKIGNYQGRSCSRTFRNHLRKEFRLNR